MSLIRIRAYAKAAHFGPTILITTISFALAMRLLWEGPAYGIAFTIFLGQLIIGWSNDIYDYGDDLKHARLNKPLVAGEITVEQLRKTTFILLPIAIIANVIGPLGVKGGLVYLLGVGCGIAYNFYFKFSPLSPLPYAVACTALPASIFFAIDRTPPMWVLAAGSMLGVAFHFLNVIKDLAHDRESGIGGLPQRLGKRASIAIALVLAIASAMLFLNRPVSGDLSSIEFNYSSPFIVGGERPVNVNMPNRYSKLTPAALLIDLHGYSGNSQSQTSFTFLVTAAEKRGLIYAAPDGLLDSQGNQFWNASKACCNFNNNPVDDVAYIQSLIDEISSKVSVDSKRIYIFGHSNGHFMTYKFACSRPETVAAIAGLAGAMDSDVTTCAPSAAVNVLHIHGTSDATILYDGGSLFDNLYTSAASSVKRWAQIDKCLTSPQIGTAFDLIRSLDGAETIPTIYSCPRTRVELWSINGGAHSPDIDLSSALKIVDWFLAHPKK